MNKEELAIETLIDSLETKKHALNNKYWGSTDEEERRILHLKIQTLKMRIFELNDLLDGLQAEIFN